MEIDVDVEKLLEIVYNKKELEQWYIRKHFWFDNKSPKDMIENNRKQEVIDFLKLFLNKR